MIKTVLFMTLQGCMFGYPFALANESREAFYASCIEEKISQCSRGGASLLRSLSRLFPVKYVPLANGAVAIK